MGFLNERCKKKKGHLKGNLFNDNTIEINWSEIVKIKPDFLYEFNELKPTNYKNSIFDEIIINQSEHL